MAPIPLKLVVVGDGGVGKSSISTALLHRNFSDEWDPTIEDSYMVNLTVDGIEYAVEIVDTAGQEEYRGLWGESTVREGDGFLLCYAIDSQTSFDLLPMFMHTIRKVKSPHENPTDANTPENTPFPFMIVGNKCDVPPSTRQISASTALAFARSAGGLFYETSAKLRVNIDAAFTSIVRATAASKRAHELWLQRYGGLDDDFSGNVAILERGALGKGEGGWEEEEPRRVTIGERKRNPKLEMDRRRSFSVGGLGAHPDTLGRDRDEGGCCAACLVS